MRGSAPDALTALLADEEQETAPEVIEQPVVVAEPSTPAVELAAQPEPVALPEEEEAAPVEETPEEEAPASVPLEDMLKRDLQAKAKELELDTRGSRAILIQRITDAQEGA